MSHLLLILCALAVTASPVPPLHAQQVQPGAMQGGPTTGEEMMQPVDMRYFLGNWGIEWTPLDARGCRAVSTQEPSECGT